MHRNQHYDALNGDPRNTNSRRSDNSDDVNHVITDIVDIKRCQKVDINDIIVKEVVQRHERIEALDAQRRIVAKADIPRGTVLGQYIGTEYLEREFDKKFESTNEETLRNMYSFDLSLHVPKGMDDEGDCKMNGNGKEEYFNDLCTKQSMVIDGWAQRHKNMMIFINDCRADIDLEVVAEEDMKYWNCSFRTVQVHGYPAVYVITRRDIKAGEELMVYYGEDYGKSVRSKAAHEQCMARIRGLVDNTILSILGWQNEEIPTDYRESYDLTDDV